MAAAPVEPADRSAAHRCSLGSSCGLGTGKQKPSSGNGHSYPWGQTNPSLGDETLTLSPGLELC